MATKMFFEVVGEGKRAELHATLRNGSKGVCAGVLRSKKKLDDFMKKDWHRNYEKIITSSCDNADEYTSNKQLIGLCRYLRERYF
jgi:hypothetical protein